MGNTNKYFIDAEVNDDEAYREAIAFANDLTKKNQKLKKVLLIGHTKANTGWLERLYGEKKVKELHKGMSLNEVANIKIESYTALKRKFSNKECVLIMMGLDDKEVFELDDNSYDCAIIAIPYLKENLKGWLTANNPIDLRSGNKYLKQDLELHCVISTALERLTGCINMGTGLSHPSDEELAKTYVRTLHRFHRPLECDKILSYLTGKLDWRFEVAQELVGYIEKLQTGKTFRGGKADEKTLTHYYSMWKEHCEKSK